MPPRHFWTKLMPLCWVFGDGRAVPVPHFWRTWPCDIWLAIFNDTKVGGCPVVTLSGPPRIPQPPLQFLRGSTSCQDKNTTKRRHRTAFYQVILQDIPLEWLYVWPSSYEGANYSCKVRHVLNPGQVAAQRCPGLNCVIIQVWEVGKQNLVSVYM